jgi:hypothetical protein
LGEATSEEQNLDLDVGDDQEEKKLDSQEVDISETPKADAFSVSGGVALETCSPVEIGKAIMNGIFEEITVDRTGSTPMTEMQCAQQQAAVPMHCGEFWLLPLGHPALPGDGPYASQEIRHNVVHGEPVASQKCSKKKKDGKGAAKDGKGRSKTNIQDTESGSQVRRPNPPPFSSYCFHVQPAGVRDLTQVKEILSKEIHKFTASVGHHLNVIEKDRRKKAGLLGYSRNSSILLEGGIP